MSEIAEPDDAKPRRGFGAMMMAGVAFLGLGAGFGTGFLGVWSPQMLLKPSKVAEETVEDQVYFEMPDIVVSIVGKPVRQLFIKVTLQLASDAEHEIGLQAPRISDSFNMFLSGIDPTAFDKRGILEIIRSELLTRARFVLGHDQVTDLLVTEFRLQ